MRFALALLAVLALVPRPLVAQTIAGRVAIMQAEERHATTVADLSTIRVGARSDDADTARLALRALGRLGRAALIPDLLAGLRHPLPEARAEAASALADATRTLKTPAAGANGLTQIQAALLTRLASDDEAEVRAAAAEALARLPYRDAADVARAAAAIVDLAGRATTVVDRLGVAKALEALVRLQAALGPPGPAVMSTLASLVRRDQPGQLSLRDARVRRLAMQALTTAGAAEPSLIELAATDPDAQVRRAAMTAAGAALVGLDVIAAATLDTAPMVRIEALRAMGRRDPDAGCGAALRAATDADMAVALVALDLLAPCGQSTFTVEYLVRTVADRADISVPRGWHRAAHAILALASAAPAKVPAALQAYISSAIWQVRAYAARAAAMVNDRPTLETLSADPEDRVANIALAVLHQPLRLAEAAKPPPILALSVNEIRQFAAPRARIHIRDVGRFEIALFTSEAPGAVIRFLRLAVSGYYNGLSFDRVVANSVVQGGLRTPADVRFPLAEVGSWPHVRGTISLATPDGSDAQLFINLVDNPQFDHEYGVFAQILNGAEVVDQILEGDIIESIEIIP